jgi:tetratricopeptide (TPR) repeat protein
MLLARDGNRQAAIAELERLLELYPAHGAAMLNLGLLHESIGNLGAAEHWYIEARKVLPNKALADAQLRRLKAAGMIRQ